MRQCAEDSHSERPEPYSSHSSASKIHDRMPVTLDEEARETWLDSKIQDAAKLEPLLVPYAEKDLVFDPITTYVNSPKNQGEKCLESAK